MRTPKGPEAVPEFRRLAIGEDADVSWRVSRGRDTVRLALHDRTAPARRSLIGAVSIPYDQAEEMRAAVGEMVLTAPDDWATRSADRFASLSRMPEIRAPKKMAIPGGVEVEWTACLTDGKAVIEARVGREGMLAIEAPGHELPRLLAMLGTLPGARAVDGRSTADVELRHG